MFIYTVHNYLSFALVTPFFNEDGICSEGNDASRLRLLDTTTENQTACENITDSSLLEACNYDVVATGDDTWSEAAGNYSET